jgi:hypothetical protein
VNRDFEVLLLKAAWHSLQGATLNYERQSHELDAAAKGKNDPLYQSATVWRDQIVDAEELMGQIEERLYDLGENVQ